MFAFFGFSLLNWGVFYNFSKSISNFAQSFELQVVISQPQLGYLQLHRSQFSLFIERNYYIIVGLAAPTVLYLKWSEI
jgi:hypothetical protein